MQNGEFQAPYDNTTKGISAVVSVMMLGAAAVLHNVYLAAPLVLVIVVAYAYSVRSYEITEGSIVVRRALAGSVRMPLSDVREARRGGAEDFQGCIRLWGSGGLFGYYGLFRTARLGRCTWYVTDRSRAVVIRTDAKTWVLSPGDVDGFLSATGVKSTGEPGGAGAVAVGSSAFNLVIGGVALAIGIAAVGFAAWAGQYSPGPPSYTVTPAGLEIHDRFYPVTVGAASVDLSGVRVVDLAEDTGWRPAARTRGFSNSHYRSGFFHAKNGRSERVYWANGTRAVLLPGKGGGENVLIEVADPEGFVRDVRGAWARLW